MKFCSSCLYISKSRLCRERSLQHHQGYKNQDLTLSQGDPILILNMYVVSLNYSFMCFSSLIYPLFGWREICWVFLEKEDVDALINSVTKNVGFSQGKPVAAFTIYKCLLHWKSFEAERTNVFDRLVQMIGSAIKVLKWDAVLSTSVQIWFLSDLND